MKISCNISKNFNYLDRHFIDALNHSKNTACLYFIVTHTDSQ